jgi:uncharacterized protein YbjT (DUF2867 family)
MRSNSDGNKPIEAYASRAVGTINQIIAFGVLAALVGCSSPASFVGKWEGKQSLSLTPGTDIYMRTTLERVALTVTPNGRFTLVVQGFPVAGRLDVDGDTAQLEADTRAGLPAAPELVGNLAFQPSGKIHLTLKGGKVVKLLQVAESQP